MTYGIFYFYTSKIEIFQKRFPIYIIYINDPQNSNVNKTSVSLNSNNKSPRYLNDPRLLMLTITVFSLKNVNNATVAEVLL